MRLTLAKKKQETPTVTSFQFTPQEPLSWKPGQFLHYVLHHEPTDERGSDRWFTVSSAPFENTVQLTTRFTPEKGSSFKNALATLKEGDTIEISDIDGDFLLEDPEKEHVFLAGGIGITPFRAILKQLAHEGKPLNATLLYANKTADDIPFKNELEALAKDNPAFHIHYILSPEHIDEQTIREAVPDLATPVFYVSGPEPMVESIGQLLKTMGVAESNIKQDWFPGYPEE